MNYYLTKTVKGDFNDVVRSIIELLEEENIEVITKIEVDNMLNKKLGIDYKKYLILGTCDPLYAIRALQSEDKIGTLLPCNVSIIDQGEGIIEVAITNASNVMRDIKNSALQLIATEMTEKFERILTKLK
jgi:uncharacterized protein (DUF302 family)